MASFTVIIQTQERSRRQHRFPTLRDAEQFARERSAEGEGVAWTEVWDTQTLLRRTDEEPIRYYENGERLTRSTGLPSCEDTTAIRRFGFR